MGKKGHNVETADVVLFYFAAHGARGRLVLVGKDQAVNRRNPFGLLTVYHIVLQGLKP